MKFIVVRMLHLFILVSCIAPSSEQGGEDISVDNEGVYTPISYKINGKEVEGDFDLGEYETGSDTIAITVDVKNNTRFPMTQMGFSYPGQVSKVFDFYDSSGGEPAYPGEGGTCTTVLYPQASCQIILSFYVAKSGVYEQQGMFYYKNLVEDDNRVVNFRIVAGQPASLIFDDGSTNQFWFGNKVGNAKKPVLERADIITYSRSLLIQNKGELSAKNVNITLPTTCASYDQTFTGDLLNYTQSGFPSVNYCEPWSILHDCPSELGVDESCSATITFVPPNQDPQWGFDQALEEVNYQAKVSIKYESSPVSSSLTTLTGNFVTNSTTIQARFKTTKLEQDFGDEVIVGNKKYDIFQIRNDGYREGELKMFVFSKDLSGSYHGEDKVYCRKYDSSSGYFKCYNEDFSTEYSLEDFPFVINGRDGCFAAPGDDPVYVPIDGTCVFDIIFQPSINYKQRYDFKYNIAINYDARHKGLETIKEVPLFDIVSKSLHTGKIEVSSIKFGGFDESLAGAIADIGIDQSVDLGRLALLSQGYEFWRTLSITFQNTGGADIDIYKAFSGITGGSTGKIELTTADGLNIGPHDIKYFKNVKIDSNNCGVSGKLEGDPNLNSGVPSSKCIITMEFAPIAQATNQKQDESMFDNLNLDPPQKMFTFTYHDGSNYSDLNRFGGSPDISSSETDAWKEYNVGITAKLIQKGILADYSELNADAGQLVRGNIKYRNLIFHNIGTGPISWIPYTGDTIDLYDPSQLNNGLTRVSVADPENYGGANYDCNKVFDFGYKGLDDNEDGNADSADVTLIKNRLATADSGAPLKKLKKLEKCVLRLRYQSTSHQYANVFTYSSIILKHINSNSLVSENKLYSVANGNLNKDVSVDFYDGDADGQQDIGTDFTKEFGEFFETTNSHLINKVSAKASFKPMARLVAVNPEPYMSASIVMPPFNQPSFDYLGLDDNVITQSAKSYARQFFSAQNLPYSYFLNGGSTGQDDPNVNTCQSVGYFESCSSRHFIKNEIDNGSIDDSDVDYVFHAGTFPINEGVYIKMSIVNVTDTNAKITNVSTSNMSDIDYSFGFAAEYVSPVNESLGKASPGSSAITGGFDVPLVFIGYTVGRHSMTYEVTYETGRDSLPTSTFKVRIIADVLDTIGRASVEVEDFDTTTGTAVLTGTKTPVGTGYNHDFHGSDFIEYKAVEVSARSETAPYLKKRVHVKNESGFKMHNLSIKYLDTPISDEASQKLSFSDTALNRAIRVMDNTCDDNNYLDDSQSCHIDLWYQPDKDDEETQLSLSLLYDTGNNRNQFVQQNIRLSFVPQEPSEVTFDQSINSEFINYDDRETGEPFNVEAYVLDFGTVTYNQNNFSYSFQKKLDNNNTQTRASLLKQYEKHRGLGNSGYDSSDITDYDSDGYTTIYVSGSSTPKIEVKANEACLFGGTNEASLDKVDKGFNQNTVEECFLKIIFTPGINMLGRSLSFTEKDDVSEVYFELEYYNNKRSSTDSVFVTLVGKVKPPASVLDNAQPYSDVVSYSGSEIQFNWTSMSPVSPEVGGIIGYRVFYSKFPDDLGNVLDMMDTNAKHVDVYTGNSIILNDSYIQDLTKYYIKVVAIRSNSGYTAGGFNNLPSGEFLSFPVIDNLEVVVPSSDFFYNHQGKMLVSYNKESGRHKYFEAISVCQNLSPVYISDKGMQSLKTFDLITQAAWDAIEVDLLVNSDYPEVGRVRHWIKSGLIYDIDNIFQNHPDYNSSNSYQRFESLLQAYFRSSSTHISEYGTSLVAKTEGGLFNNSVYEGYEAFMGPGIPEGIARCYIPLD